MESYDLLDPPPPSERTVIIIGFFGGALAVMAAVIGLVVRTSGSPESPPIKAKAQFDGNGELKAESFADNKPLYMGIQGEDDTAGARLTSVSDNTPADKGGLKVGDIITQIGDERVKSYEGLVAEIRKKQSNDKIKLTLSRGGETKQLDITLTDEPEPPKWVSNLATPTRVILGVLALILAGVTVTLRPRWFGSWLLAGVTCLFSGLGFPASWDSFRMVAFAFGGLAFAGSILSILPFGWRITVVSVAVVYHFGGIFNSIIKPYPSPDLASNVWTVAYRPYSEFAYLVNAYQFYSPNPGPASYLWFCVEYENHIDDPVQFEILRQDSNDEPIRDVNRSLVYVPMMDKDGDLAGYPILDAGKNPVFTRKRDRYGNEIERPKMDINGKPIYLKIAAWLKTPQKPDEYKDPLGQAYYRRLSLTENASLTGQVNTANYETMRLRRVQHGFPRMPFNNNDQRYFRWPSDDVVSQTLPSYVRHVAHEFHRPGRKIRNIKVYRVEHEIVDPKYFWSRQSYPFDPTTYLPYFMGDYTTEGELKDINDPMLYFLIPILRSSDVSDEEFNKRNVRNMTMADYRKLFDDWVEKHAGCSHLKGNIRQKGVFSFN